jgi:hypothetical protein
MEHAKQFIHSLFIIGAGHTRFITEIPKKMSVFFYFSKEYAG